MNEPTRIAPWQMKPGDVVTAYQRPFAEEVDLTAEGPYTLTGVQVNGCSGSAIASFLRADGRPGRSPLFLPSGSIATILEDR